MPLKSRSSPHLLLIGGLHISKFGTCTEWGALVGAKEVSVMVSSIRLAGIILCHLGGRTGVGQGVGVAGGVEAPGVGHHEVEVLVVFDVGRDVVVVLTELLEGDLSIASGLLVIKRMMRLKSLHKLLEHLLLCLFARSDFRMAQSIVLISDLINVDGTILIDIEGPKGSLDQLSSSSGHVADNSSEELIELDLAGHIGVHGLKEVVDVLRLHIDAKVSDGLLELVLVQLSVSGVISDFELSLKAKEGVSSAFFEGLPKSLNEHALELWNWLLILLKWTRHGGLSLRCLWQLLGTWNGVMGHGWVGVHGR